MECYETHLNSGSVVVTTAMHPTESDIISATGNNTAQPSTRNQPSEEWSSEKESVDSEGRQREAEELPEFFDPDLDEQDEAWMDQQRQGRKADAILSCPCCLATCCIDCQQHDYNPGQYRAMFVTNCRVRLEETLSVAGEAQANKKRGRREEKREIEDQGFESDMHPFDCDVCGTHLGFFDIDEVYHFTCAIASEA